MPIYELMISIETKCKDEWELKEKLRKVLKKEKMDVSIDRIERVI